MKKQDGFVTCFACGKTEADITLTKTELRKRLRNEGWASGPPWSFLPPIHPEYERARQERKPHIDKCPECSQESARAALEKMADYAKAEKHLPEPTK